jgi:hypothetical protein
MTPVTPRSLRRSQSATTRAVAAAMAGVAGIGSAAWGISQFVTPYRGNVAKTSDRFPAPLPLVTPVVASTPAEAVADPTGGYDIDAALASVSASLMSLADTVTSSVGAPGSVTGGGSGGTGGTGGGNGGGGLLPGGGGSILPGPKDDDGLDFSKPDLGTGDTVNSLPVVCDTVTEAVTPAPGVTDVVQEQTVGCETAAQDPTEGDAPGDPTADATDSPSDTASGGSGSSDGSDGGHTRSRD